MNRLIALLLTLTMPSLANAGSLFASGLEAPHAERIDWLGDEFDEAASIADFRRIWRVEHWPFDQLQTLDINLSSAGRLVMQPFSSGWWQDYRAELSYKEISGDLVATTLVYPRNRTGTGAPGSTNGGAVESEYSLAGLMLRVPRRDVEQNNANWVRGRESFVFLSMGAADQPGSYQFEDKTTRPAQAGENHSISVRLITNAPGGATAAYLRIVRVGPHVLLLLRPFDGGASGQWQVLRRFRRDDFPAQLQLGFVAYTDWATMRDCSYEQHNLNLLAQSCSVPPQAADPDLRASFEFLRLTRPSLPDSLAGADLSNPAAVSNAQVLAAFGFDP